MSYNGHDAYFESRVLAANPVELVNMLYEGCTTAVREARRHLAEGRIAERSREINKAYEILAELTVSLDHERGGEISPRLALLYDYMQRRLLDANRQQADAPLAETLGLLGTLSEAWAGVRAQDLSPVAQAPKAETQPAEAAASQAPSAWGQPSAQETTSYAPSAWGQPPAQETTSYAPSAWGQPSTQETTSYAPSAWAQPPAQETTSYAPSAWGQPSAQEATSYAPSAWAQPPAHETTSYAPSAWAQSSPDEAAPYSPSAWSL